MKIPLIAIVGRPNVGKSTLFNRVIGRKQALVYDKPGVTRDRHYAEGEWGGFLLRWVDTGGYEVDPHSELFAQMRRQIEFAMREADLLLLVIDGRLGPTSEDKEMAKRLRRLNKKVFLVVNKIDLSKDEILLSACYELGFKEIFPVSSEHGRKISDLLDAIVTYCQQQSSKFSALSSLQDLEDSNEQASYHEFESEQDLEENEHFEDFENLERVSLHPDLPLQDFEDDETFQDSESPEKALPSKIQKDFSQKENHRIRLAILGRPNVGKSTLLNRIYGAPRAVVHAQPGTTRDPLEVEIEIDGMAFCLVDTAGIRRRSKAEDKIETVSVMKSLETIQKSDVVLLIAEAPLGLTAQDAKVAQEVLKRGKGLLVFFNKWDCLPPDIDWKKLREALEHEYEFMKFVPAFRLSAKTGFGASRIFQEVARVDLEAGKRLKTSQLNKTFQDLVHAYPPPTISGKNWKLSYMTQVGARPPRFVVFGNRSENIPESYRRYLINGFRKSFGFWGVPLFLEFRARKKWGEGGERVKVGSASKMGSS